MVGVSSPRKLENTMDQTLGVLSKPQLPPQVTGLGCAPMNPPDLLFLPSTGAPFIQCPTSGLPRQSSNVQDDNPGSPLRTGLGPPCAALSRQLPWTCPSSWLLGGAWPHAAHCPPQGSPSPSRC